MVEKTANESEIMRDSISPESSPPAPSLRDSITRGSRRMSAGGALDVSVIYVALQDSYQKGVWKFTYEHFYKRSFFWFITTTFIVMEPILCSYNPSSSRAAYYLQIAVLIGSTICFIVQLVGNVAYKHMVLNDGDVGATTDVDKILDLRNLLFTGAFVLEFFCLLCGWVFIFIRPGIATLRCFRVFRILYYHELPTGHTAEHPTEKGVLEAVKDVLDKLHYFVGGAKQRAQQTELVLRVSKFASNCLQNMAQEMFFLTDQTRGGFILMVMLFYSAYVVGCSMWTETMTNNITPINDSCLTLGACVFTLLRLTFYDGTGLDYLWSLSADNKFLFAILVVYLCSTAFGILNGLIGIFGDIFNDNSDKIFQKEGDSEAEVARLNKDLSELLVEFKTIKDQLHGVSSRLKDLS